jgi:CheY-like chemotaxis protein
LRERGPLEQTHGMRALIVDDSAAARAQARSALDQVLAGHGALLSIDEASGGVEAMHVLTSAEIDLLIVDLHMPGIHGLDVLSFWSRRLGHRDGRAVIMSTQVSTTDRERALQHHGVAGFIEKPVTLDALRHVVGGFLSPSRSDA